MLKSKNKAIRFTHINLGNWRNFAHVDVDLQRRGFFVGPNASGKSNFLDVFRFLALRTFVWVTPIYSGHAAMTWNAPGLRFGYRSRPPQWK